MQLKISVLVFTEIPNPHDALKQKLLNVVPTNSGRRGLLYSAVELRRVLKDINRFFIDCFLLYTLCLLIKKLLSFLNV